MKPKKLSKYANWIFGTIFIVYLVLRFIWQDYGMTELKFWLPEIFLVPSLLLFAISHIIIEEITNRKRSQNQTGPSANDNEPNNPSKE